MKRSPSFIFFLVGWGLISLLLGHFRYFSLRPDGVHQGAQTDRACIARNWAERDFNFFIPKVNETLVHDGETGCEFPLFNALAAVSYKIFGFHEGWYRFWIWAAFSLGLYAAFRIARYYLVGNFISFTIALLWSFSPILQFYIPNFLPDAAALGLTMTAWFFFFRQQHQPQTKGNTTGYLTFGLLASLIKITSLVGVISLILITLFHKIIFKNKPIHKPYSFLLSAIIICLLTGAWYYYAAYLSKLYYSPYFMVWLPQELTFENIQNNLVTAYNNWHTIIYPDNYLVFLLLFIAFGLLSIDTKNPLLWILFVANILGSIAVLTLLSIQFINHDYYFISLFPFIFFLLLHLMYYIRINKPKYYTLAAIIVVIGAIFSLDKCMLSMQARTTQSHFWYQPVIAASKLVGLEKQLDSIGISKNEKIACGYDASPNTLLYFANRKGIRFNHDFPAEMVLHRIKEKQIKWLLLSDTSYLQAAPLLQSIATSIPIQNPSFHLYKLNY